MTTATQSPPSVLPKWFYRDRDGDRLVWRPVEPDPNETLVNAVDRTRIVYDSLHLYLGDPNADGVWLDERDFIASAVQHWTQCRKPFVVGYPFVVKTTTKVRRFPDGVLDVAASPGERFDYVGFTLADVPEREPRFGQKRRTVRVFCHLLRQGDVIYYVEVKPRGMGGLRSGMAWAMRDFKAPDVYTDELRAFVETLAADVGINLSRLGWPGMLAGYPY